MHYRDMENEFLSADEAAEMLHMHPRTIRRLLASGELPGTRLGRQWRISVTSVRTLIEGGGKPRSEPLSPQQSRKVAKKAATDPAWKNKTTGAKKI